MAEQDNWPANPSEQPASEQQKSSGGCMKIGLIIGGLGLVLVLVCCGGFAFFAGSFVPKIVTTPAEVAAMSKQIVEMDIPPEFQGEAGFNMDNFAVTMRMVKFKHNAGKGDLMLMNIKVKMGDPKQKIDFKNQQGMNDKERNLELGDSTTKDFDIRGQKVTFRFTEAVDSDKNVPCHVVEGSIAEPNGTTEIKLVLEDDAYDEEAVVKMIESIR
jgi:hypothetical protein